MLRHIHFGGPVDSRARARSLQFCDALDDSWEWRKRGCREGDVDIDVQAICGVAEEVVHGVHHSLALVDIWIGGVVHGGVDV